MGGGLIFLALVSGFGILYYIAWLLSKYRLKWKVVATGIPEYKGPPIVCNIFQVVKFFNLAPGVPPSVYILEAVFALINFLNAPKILFGSFGSMFYVVVNSAETVEELLSSNKEVNKTPEYKFMESWLGSGLVTSSYFKWKKQRKLLTPAFHFRILDQFHPTMVSKTQILIQKLKGQLHKPFVSIEPYISRCTLDIIAETALGVSADTQKEEDSPFVTSIHRITNLLFRRISSPWLWPDPLFHLSPTGREFRRHCNFLRNFVKEVIRQKKDNLAQTGRPTNEEEGVKGRRAFLDLLLQHNLENTENVLSEKDIEDEVHTFSFAGHDTTTISITWALYLLGIYPEIQRKVQEEIDSIFGEDLNEPVSLEGIRELHYLENVFKETVRLYPPVPFIARTLQDDMEIGSYVVPKSSTVAVVLPVLHRDPKYFPNPEVFDPDRFSDSSGRHPFAYIPFSAGPRNCVGQRFAMLEVKTVLCMVLRNFELTSLDPRDKVLLSPDLMSRPSRAVRIRLVARRPGQDH